MQYRQSQKENVKMEVIHRNGDLLAELIDIPGLQPFVKVYETSWSKLYKVPTHNRYFRNIAEAGKFIKKTFK